METPEWLDRDTHATQVEQGLAIHELRIKQEQLFDQVKESNLQHEKTQEQLTEISKHFRLQRSLSKVFYAASMVGAALVGQAGFKEIPDLLKLIRSL